jgi:hypothetical protein
MAATTAPPVVVLRRLPDAMFEMANDEVVALVVVELPVMTRSWGKVYLVAPAKVPGVVVITPVAAV